MTDNGGVRICHRANETLSLALAIELEAAMDACHHEIELFEHVDGIIQRSVGENIRLDPFEDAKALAIPAIEAVDLDMLAPYPLDR